MISLQKGCLDFWNSLEVFNELKGNHLYFTGKSIRPISVSKASPGD
jgi:hypothetical protein